MNVKNKTFYRISKEKKIKKLLALGLTNREIAKKVFMAEGSLKNYLTYMFKEIGVKNRTQAALFWDKEKQE